MTKDTVMKTGFDFYIIDLFIFGALAGIITLMMSGIIWFFLGEIGKELSPIIFFLSLIVLMYWNYKFRYEERIKKTYAIEILKTRYVKGEITKEQFEEMKKEIEQ
jgi:uncharacterized membrane protein